MNEFSAGTLRRADKSPSSNPPADDPTDPPTSPPGPGNGCTASVSLNSWSSGFVATVKVTAGSSGTSGWTVAIPLPGVTNAWNTSATGSSGTVQFRNVAYNGRINAGQSIEFGFQGAGSASSLTATCTAS